MMVLFQLTTPFTACIQCMHMVNKRHSVLNVPLGAAPTWVINQGTVMECVVTYAVVGRGCVETAVFTQDVWNTTTAVRNMEYLALSVLIYFLSAALVIQDAEQTPIVVLTVI